jgi:hypothetical protein
MSKPMSDDTARCLQLIKDYPSLTNFEIWAIMHVERGWPEAKKRYVQWYRNRPQYMANRREKVAALRSSPSTAARSRRNQPSRSQARPEQAQPR